MISKEIGQDAGKVWSYLSSVDEATPTKIASETGVAKNDLQRAIGWLAREGKLTLKREGRRELISLSDKVDD